MKLLIWLAGILAIFLAAVFGLSVYLSPDDLANCGAQPAAETACAKAEAIVAISGGDTAARTQKAVELYQQNWADKIIFAGAAADPNSPSNAEQMREIALRGGVPDSAILVEETSRNTNENAANVAKILQQNNWKNVILVSENYHLRRAKMYFMAADADANFRTASAKVDRGWWLTPTGWVREFSELGGIIKFWISGGKS